VGRCSGLDEAAGVASPYPPSPGTSAPFISLLLFFVPEREPTSEGATELVADTASDLRFVSAPTTASNW